MIDYIEIVSVNYNTPDLIERLIESVLQHEDKYPIRIIDGSDREPYISQIKQICDRYDNVTLDQLGWNIHHGRGMDYALNNTLYDFVLILDSDNYILQPCIRKVFNAMLDNNKELCAYHCFVNEHGISAGRNITPQYPITYYHPAFFLIKTDIYHELRKRNAGFIHHGAPCINMANFLHKNNIDIGITLADALKIESKDYGQYVCLDSRGTRKRFGDNY